MNFLAHLYLSQDDEDSIIGNFIADHVKGSSINSYSSAVQKGILFHRAVDEFTDSNPVVKYTILNLRPLFRKYAGVALDMYYDHFLAAEWDKYSDEKLEEFVSGKLAVIKRHMDILPERSAFILPIMINENWLVNYRTFEGLHDALSGISSRTRFSSNLHQATLHLQSNYTFYRNSFNEFFPQLIEFCKTKK